MMRPLIRACLLAAALPLVAGVEAGNPSVRVYQPWNYGAQSQNWAVIQDLRGIIYVGNGEGVLEFDGVRWRLIPTPNRSAVRSLAMDASGRIYVGAMGELGYLAPDAQGRMGYVSLNDRLPPAQTSFSDVWKTFSCSRGVYFFTRNFIFLLTPKGFQSWQTGSQHPMHLAFGVGDRYFVQQMDIGLQELDGEGLKPVPCGASFKREKIFFMLPWDPPQAGKPARILIGTRSKGLLLYDGATLTPFRTEADAFLKQHLLYQAALLKDGTLALATLEGGVALVARNGSLQLILDRRTGLQDATVYALAPDNQGGLWMGLGNGIARLQWPAPYSRFNTANGLEGTVLSVHRHGQTLVVGTSQGVYQLDSQTLDHQARFRTLPGIQSQTWAFASMGETLLAANYQGLYEIQAGKATALPGWHGSFYALHPSAKDSRRLFLGLASGLASVRRATPHGPWVNEGLYPGITTSVRSMAEDDQGNLWLGARGREALRVRFSTSGPGGPAAPVVEHFGPAQGLPVKREVIVSRIGGRVTFSTDAGVFQFQEATQSFQPDPRFAAYFANGPKRVVMIREDTQARVWMETLNEATSQHEVAVGTLAASGVFAWETAHFNRFCGMDLNDILSEPGGIVWFGGPEGLFRYDPSLSRGPAQPFAARVRTVSTPTGALLHADAPGAPFAHTLKPRENALRFEFSATSFDSDWTNLYQIRLDGYDTDWSPWSSTTFKEYSLLREGHYVFRVRARNAFGSLSQEGVWSFTIQPPWPRTWWARCLFLGLGSAAILAGHTALTRYLRKRNLELERRVREATQEIQQHEATLAAQAEDLARVNQELRALNEQKSQFIGIVAHDLRNPLNGILLASEMLGEASTDRGVTRLSSMIQRECQDMDSLIGRFLDISAIEAGTICATLAPYAMGELVRQVAGRHVPRAEQKGIIIALDLAQDLGAEQGLALVDPHFAKEVLDNLLSNAVKFSPANTTITLHLHLGPDTVHLVVQDQGPGISQEDQARLFVPYTRLSALPTGGERSLGLGLSIVKHLVNAMNSKIWVVSAPGEGAAFHVEFPAAIS